MIGFFLKISIADHLRSSGFPGLLSPVDSSDIIMRIPRWLVVLGPLISVLVAQATQARAADVIAKRLAWKKKAYYRTDEFGLSRTAISERLGTVCDHYPMSSRYVDPFREQPCREPGDCVH